MGVIVMMDEELILYTLAQRMTEVRWTRVGDTPDQRKFITVSRRVKIFSDVPTAQQPACFQAEWATTELQVSNMPYKTTLEVNWIIFQCVNKGSTKALGAVENNLILGGVRRVLAPTRSDPGYQDKRNTLNGLVWHCHINGRIFKDPGDIDGQGMMVVPIKLLVPS